MNPNHSLIAKTMPLAWPVRLLVIFFITTVLMSFGSGGFSGPFVPPAVSAQSFQSEISGIVVNGTEGGAVPADLQVLLLTVDDAAGQIIEQVPNKKCIVFLSRPPSNRDGDDRWFNNIENTLPAKAVA